jgi:predicted DNA-binding transcriptional regulator YafY
MGYQEYFFKMAYLCQLIEKERTGNAECLSRKLKVSRRTIFRYLDELKLNGAKVSFCRHKNSFVFETQFDIRDKLLKPSGL